MVLSFYGQRGQFIITPLIFFSPNHIFQGYDAKCIPLHAETGSSRRKGGSLHPMQPGLTLYDPVTQPKWIETEIRSKVIARKNKQTSD